MDANIPPELNGPIPRKVIATRKGMWTLAVTAIIFVLASVPTVWMGVLGVNEFQDLTEFERGSIQVDGIVTETRVGKPPTVDYSFMVDGKSFSGESHPPQKIFQNLHDSDTLSIRYLPANPAVNHPTKWNDGPRDFITFLLPLPFALAGFIYLVSLIMERSLIANGVPAAAVVIQNRDSGRGGPVAKYEFRTESGTTMKKKVGVPRSLAIGSSLWIVYLPQHPWRSQPYPSPYFRVADQLDATR